MWDYFLMAAKKSAARKRAAGPNTAGSAKRENVTESAAFQYRILLVDADSGFLQVCSDTLRREGYQVLIADDGFAALCALRRSRPDLLVTELNLPRMSGFELLSVVRTRFPDIAVIALSGDYTPLTVPHEAICDGFLAKGPNLDFELIQELQKLVSESPVRGSRAKSELAPVWIPHSSSGYIVLTCPECLRSFSAAQPRPGPATETCVCCGAKVPFQMSSVEVPPSQPPASVAERLHRAFAKSRKLRAEGHVLRDKRHL
jgi:CheY-like chemotaxis protein